MPEQRVPEERLTCRREFPERSYERCGKPAEYIVWGKLFDKDALGPRCRHCVEDQCGYRAWSDQAYAIYRLPDLAAIRKQEYQRIREALEATFRKFDVIAFNQVEAALDTLEDSDQSEGER